MRVRAHRSTAPRLAGLRVGTLNLRVHHGNEPLPPSIPSRDELAHALEAGLSGVIDPDDPSYWVIRRLSLPFRTEARPGQAALAAAFTDALRDAVQRVLRGEIVDGVRRFDSRAAWLAECLWLQATDPGRREWVFDRYAHHTALPPADATRLTIAAEPEAGPAALACLARTRRIRRFARRIGERGARAVLKQILPQVASTVPDQSLRAMLGDERAAMPGGRFAPALTVVALRLRDHPAAPLPPLAALTSEIATGKNDRSRARGVGAATRDAALRAVADAMPPGDTEGSVALPRPSDVTVPGPRAHARGPQPIPTEYAGVFVLWRSVNELGLLDLLPGGPKAGPARLALAAAMTGPDHAAAWADPALHWLTGYEPEGDKAPSAPADLHRRLTRHIVDWRAPRPVAPMIRQAGRTWLLQDLETEDWLSLGTCRDVSRLATGLGHAIAAPPATARDPAVDLAFFDVAHRRARRGWALLARAAYGDFARRLHGLERSSAAWLWDRLLSGPGVLHTGAEARMMLPRVPLDFVLRMGGLNGTQVRAAAADVQLCLPGAG